MTDEEIEVRPEDALAVAQRALAKVNDLEDELADLQAAHEDALEELTALSLRLEEWDEERSYDSLTLDEKVGMVREHAYRKAINGHGRARLDYDDVMWEVFDGNPGTKHCYKLIRLAAGLDGEKTGSGIPGFWARDPDGENYHLAVDASAAQRGEAFFPENKAVARGGRSR